MLEKCRSEPQNAARACPGAAECSKSGARACSGATESSKSVARAYPRATVGLKSAARAHSREVRSFLALENCCLLFVCYRHQLLLGSTLLRRPRSCWGVRIGRSSPLGLAAPSTGQSRTKTNRPGQAKPTRSRLAGRGHGCLLHYEPGRPRWGARIGRSSPLGLAGALYRTEPHENEPNQTGQAYSETLRWAGPPMPVALNTETNILRALNARRSFLALGNCCLLFVCYRPPLLLGSTLLRRARSCWGV